MASENFGIFPVGVCGEEAGHRSSVNVCVEEGPHPHPCLASVPEWAYWGLEKNTGEPLPFLCGRVDPAHPPSRFLQG